MGLDMYLNKKTYIGAKYDFYGIKGRLSLTANGKKIPIKLKRVGEIVEEVAYWRKANAIHNWFVENVQDGKDDCEEYTVSLAQLKELLDVCRRVKAASHLVKGTIANGYTFEKDGKEKPILEEGRVVEDSDAAQELLPTTSGFFFGSTDYDEYYMADIDLTIEQIEPLVEELESEKLEGRTMSTIYYQSSW
jgi:hypothetical protein